MECSPRIYIVAQTDSGSDSKLEAFESAHGSKPQDYSVIRIPRSREVGQSYVTSIYTTLKALLFCWNVVVKNQPDLVRTKLVNNTYNIILYVLSKGSIFMLFNRSWLMVLGLVSRSALFRCV